MPLSRFNIKSLMIEQWLFMPFLETLAQVLLKLGGESFVEMPLGWPWLVTLVTSPMILLSLCCDGLSFFIWMRVLSKHDISIAFPITSLCYVTISASGWLFFAEPVMPSQVIGVLLIMGGVALVADKRVAPPI